VSRILSILHHPIPSVRPGRIAEEDGLGWHFRSARALVKYGSYGAIAIRPSGSGESLFKVVDSVIIGLMPSVNLSPSPRLWKWSHVSPALADAAREFIKRDCIPYIHGYRSLNSELVIRKIIGYPVILQHHGSSPSCKLNPMDPLSMVKALSMLRRDLYLRRIKGFFFVLNKYEAYYLKEILNVDAEVRVRTMAVDFNELKPLSEDEKIGIKKSLGLKGDDVLLCTYVGVFGEEFSSMKGAQHLFRIWHCLRTRFGKKVKIVVTGVGEPYLSALRRLSVIAYRLLPHRDYVRTLAASDVYFLPATSSYLYGGISVTIMEAMALGVPIISPTLREFPEPSRVKDLGVATRWVDDEGSLREFIDALIYVVENRDYYKPWVIRELGSRYYSWEGFVDEFNGAVERL